MDSAGTPFLEGDIMATVYVSYRSTERVFVETVMSRLEKLHDIRIDYKIPVGADWNRYQLDELRTSEVFIVFVSHDTHCSDLQSSEIGGALFCSNLVDGKLIVPGLLDTEAVLPRPLRHLDYLDLRHRNVGQAANEIHEVIVRHAQRVRLFISHAHADAELASRLVEVINTGLKVPAGALRCTSVPGYQLDLGAVAPDVLRRELGSALCIVAVLTPNSLSNAWVLFELGAAWASAKLSIPLLAGGLEDKDIPGPFRGLAGGQLTSPTTLDRMIDQLEKALGWEQKNDVSARNKRYELVKHIEKSTFSRDPLEAELKASFVAKRSRIGPNQNQVLDYITARQNRRQNIPQEELEKRFADVKSSLYYRLEQLRLLGFVERMEIDELHGNPVFGWMLSERYRREVGL
jgi:hypothetical protein